MKDCPRVVPISSKKARKCTQLELGSWTREHNRLSEQEKVNGVIPQVHAELVPDLDNNGH
jgi:hypothetical protein